MFYSSSEPCFSHSQFNPTKPYQSLSEHISRCPHFLHQSKTWSGTYLCLALISKEGCTCAVQRETVKCSSQVPHDEAIWISGCSETCAPFKSVRRQCQGKPTSPPSSKSSFWRWMESLSFFSHFHTCWFCPNFPNCVLESCCAHLLKLSWLLSQLFKNSQGHQWSLPGVYGIRGK